MKVSVLGAGAIGSMFGGLIRHHSPTTEVVLVTRGEHLRRIEQQGGVRLVGPWGDVTVDVQATDQPDAITGSNAVLLTVKSYSTEAAMIQAQPFLGDAMLISIQNGINQRRLSRFVPIDRLVMGMTATSIAMTEPGTVDLRRNGLSVIGPASDQTPKETVDSAARLLRLSNLDIGVEPNIIGAQYNKLIFNTLGVASSLTNCSLIPEAISNTRWRNRVALRLQQEALDVLQHANIQVADLPDGSSVWKFRRLLKGMNVPFLGVLVRAVVWKMFRDQPIRFSFGEDLRRGKPTEIDSINGEIVRLAEEIGCSAPLNAKVMRLVEQFSTRGEPFTLDELSDELERGG